jgi:hypothetical protein
MRVQARLTIVAELDGRPECGRHASATGQRGHYTSPEATSCWMPPSICQRSAGTKTIIASCERQALALRKSGRAVIAWHDDGPTRAEQRT